MLRFLLAAVAAASCALAIAGPTPQPARPTALKLTQGTVTRTLPVSPPCVKCTFTDVQEGSQRKISVGGSWTTLPVSGGAISSVWVFPPTQCPAIPPPASQAMQCPAGTTGTWTQTHGWTQAPFPGCALTALPWTPTSAPPGACTPVAPPSGLTFDLSYVDRTSPGYLRFKSYVDAAIASNGSDFDERPIDIMLMQKITSDPAYAAAAVAEVDRQVIAAATAAFPAVTNDSYLGVGEMIGEVAIAYPQASPAQKVAWKAYADQTIFNVWNPSLAQWHGQPAPWTGWSIDNPGNNYYYSFIQATMWWALASGSTAIVHDGKTALEYLRTDRIPKLAAYYAAIPGGGSMEGTGYGVSHRVMFGELMQVWYDSGQGDLRNAHETNSGELWVNITMPDRAHFLPVGDQSRESGAPWYDYQRDLVLQVAHQTQSPQVRADIGWLLGNLRDGDGSPYDEMQNTYSFRYDLIPYSAGTEPIARTFRAPEVGIFTARTDWTPNATFLGGVMGQYSESHAHQEQGGITLFGRGHWLSAPGNIWSHSGLHQDTTDKNIPRFVRNGQVIKQQLQHAVNVTAYAPNPVTGDTHIVGDVSPLYADAGVRWVRTIDFVSGVTTIDDAMTLGAGVTAVWQLHVPTQPLVTGNIITAGDLEIQVIAPQSPQISVVDMRGVDPDYGSGWRIDIAGAAFKVALRAN